MLLYLYIHHLEVQIYHVHRDFHKTLKNAMGIKDTNLPNENVLC